MSKTLKTKRLTDKFVAEWESDQALTKKIQRRVARIRPKSKVAGAASRRDPLEDIAIFKEIRASMTKGCITILDAGSKPLVPKWKDKIYLKKKEYNEEKEQEARTIWTPDWTHTGDRLKLLAMGASMTGPMLTFTLRLGSKEIEAAYASPRGFVGYFTERMKRAFLKAGDPSPQYAFILEASPIHEIHLHGIISSPVSNIRAVLAKVGGETEMRAKERQAHTAPIHNLLGWANYIAKAPLMTADALRTARMKRTLPERRDNLIGAPTHTRASAKAWYQAQRKSGAPLPKAIGGLAPTSPSLLEMAKGS